MTKQTRVVLAVLERPSCFFIRVLVAAVVLGVASPAFSQLASGLLFVPVTPCRVVDTRNANGPFGGPAIPGLTTRSFAIPQGACGIPNSARAYALNMTIVPTVGFLNGIQVWPTGQTPNANVWFAKSDSRFKAIAAIVPADPMYGGSLSFYPTETTNLVLDISGYFVPVSSGSNLAFYPLSPCRVADTRNVGGPISAGGCGVLLSFLAGAGCRPTPKRIH